MGDKLDLKLLGSPHVLLNNNPVTHFKTIKAQALLYYLATTSQSRSRSQLAGLLWGDFQEAKARANLSKALSELRSLIGDYIIVKGQQIQFDKDNAYRLDVECLESSLADGAEKEKSAQLRQAVDLYDGDFLEGLSVRNAPDFETWLFAERDRLRELVVQAFSTLSNSYMERKEWTQSIDYTRRLLTIEPWSEKAHRELMRLYAWTDQQVAAMRQYQICVDILDADLGVPPARETTELYEAIRSRRFPPPLHTQQEMETQAVARVQDAERQLPGHALAAASTSRTTPSDLPAQPTPFVGRQEELADILRRLQDPECHLLTLVGPGGIGKTRLAIQTAQHLLSSPSMQNDFANGIFFIPLQPVSTESGIVSAIAESTNFRFRSDAPPREQLMGYLRQKHILLVLDNFEHLLNSAELVAEILSAAPDVKILATSREALKLRQEWFQPMTGMRFSGASAASDRAVLDYDAVRLFVQNARRARPHFSLEEEHEHVLRICRLVDGMPLGIEQAAAWLKVLPCAQIAAEIERGLDILSTRHQDVPERHRSMRVLMEQSWELLSEGEQDVLKRLSVFQGGFSRDAAEEIAGASLLTLANLVEKSLLQASQSGRYQIHELLRQFAQEKLAQNQQDESVTSAQHSAFYLDYVSARQEALNAYGQQTALEEMGAEIDNIRTAWNWAVEQEEWESLDQAVHGLYDFYRIRSRNQEGYEDMAYAVTPLNRSVPNTDEGICVRLLGRLLARWGAHCFELGAYEQAEEQLNAALRLGCEAGEYRLALHFLGRIAKFGGQRLRAETLLEQSLAVGRQIGDLVGQVHDLHGLTAVSLTFGKNREAKRMAGEALDISRPLGNLHLTAHILVELGAICNALGEYIEAERYLQEALATFRQLGDENGMARALNHLGWTEYSMGGEHLSQAKAYHEQSLIILRQTGDRGNMAMCLSDLALAASEWGDCNLAKESAREGLQMAREIGHLDMVCYGLEVLGATACAEGDLTAARDYLIRSLSISVDKELLIHVAGALYHLARVLVAEGEQLLDTAERMQKQKIALTYLLSIPRDPGSWRFVNDRATDLATRLRLALPSEIVSAVEGRVAQTTLYELAAAILNDEKKK